MPHMVRLLAVLALALTATGCVTPQSVEPPGIALQNVRILKAEGLTQRLEVVLLVSNPNKFNIPLNGVEFSMQLNGQPFARGLSSDRVDIPRLGRATVSVVVDVSVVSIFKQLRAVSKAGRLDYRIAGKAFLDHVLISSVPFDREGSVILNRDSGTPRFEPV